MEDQVFIFQHDYHYYFIIIFVFFFLKKKDPSVFSSEIIRNNMKNGSKKLGILKMLLDHPKIQPGEMNQEV